jgi:hypothetical protein
VVIYVRLTITNGSAVAHSYSLAGSVVIDPAGATYPASGQGNNIVIVPPSASVVVVPSFYLVAKNNVTYHLLLSVTADVDVHAGTDVPPAHYRFTFDELHVS